MKHAHVRRNTLGFYSCVSYVHTLRRIVNRALDSVAASPHLFHIQQFLKESVSEALPNVRLQLLQITSTHTLTQG